VIDARLLKPEMLLQDVQLGGIFPLALPDSFPGPVAGNIGAWKSAFPDSERFRRFRAVHYDAELLLPGLTTTFHRSLRLSFLDAILADRHLPIDHRGVQVYEATTLVEEGLAIDPRVPAVIAQIGSFGQSGAQGMIPRIEEEMVPLVRYLRRTYPADHPVTICDADASGVGLCYLETPLGILHRLADTLSYASSLLVAGLPA